MARTQLWPASMQQTTVNGTGNNRSWLHRVDFYFLSDFDALN